MTAAIQTFGNRINFHPHIHFLATEGGLDATGVFYNIPHIDDERLAEIFAREVLSFLVGREILSPEWAERLISWPHSWLWSDYPSWSRREKSVTGMGTKATIWRQWIIWSSSPA